MMWTALPSLPQHDLRVSRKESDDEAGHDDWIGYREVRFSGAAVTRPTMRFVGVKTPSLLDA
jgi:hypothetical protein